VGWQDSSYTEQQELPVIVIYHMIPFREAIPDSQSVKDFEDIPVGVARRDKPSKWAVFLCHTFAHISKGGTYGNQ